MAFLGDDDDADDYDDAGRPMTTMTVKEASHILKCAAPRTWLSYLGERLHEAQHCKWTEVCAPSEQTHDIE